jgi:co-chaperonin GroES (HSP10)
MKLSKQDIERLRPAEGFVLLRINNVKKTQTDSGLYIPELLAEETRNALLSRKGTVVAISSSTDVPHYNFNWDTDCEIEVGDEVYYSQHAISDIYANPNKIGAIEVEGDFYATIPYKFLVLRERGMLGLNDSVFIRPIEKKVDSVLDLSFTTMAKPRGDKMEVVHVPSFTCRYKSGRVSGVVGVGDYVNLRGKGATLGRLGSDLRREGEDLYYVKAIDIMGVYETKEA